MVASPGNAPGLQGYEPQVETSRLAIDLVVLKNWSRRQDSHLLSRASKARSSSTSPSPRSENEGKSGLRRSPAFAVTCAGLSQGFAPPPSRLVPRRRELWVPHDVSLHGCLFSGVASYPCVSRYSTIGLPSILPDRERARTLPCSFQSTRGNLADSVGPWFRPKPFRD